MEKYTEITFVLAMAVIAMDKLDNLYFKHDGQIRKVSNYTFNISRLKDKQWFYKEVIE